MNVLMNSLLLYKIYMALLSDFFMMVNFLDHIWSYIIKTGELYLDCEIRTHSSKVFTNKCFLSLSNLFEDSMLEYQELLVIFMPDHSLPEVYQELRGFLTDQKCVTFMPNYSLPEVYQKFVTDKNCVTPSPVPDVYYPVTPTNKHNESSNLNQRKPSTLKLNSKKIRLSQPLPKLYQCESCGKLFKDSKSCRQHKYQVHGNGVQYGCTICDKNFKTPCILGRG